MHCMDDNSVSRFELVEGEDLRDLAFHLMIEYGEIQDLKFDERIYTEGWKRRQYEFKQKIQLEKARF
ncbi:hypothetical protein [Paraglaciecola sp.]|uniref:hypothetical protein n=1 Tax=Paraglaciecola sp. TaxID=1920173 RepID=UPI0030F3B2BE